MATHVALVRGINVGGRNKIAMADLRAMVSDLGFADVSTYIQSGNVLLSASETHKTHAADNDAISLAIAGGLSASFGLEVGVVVVSRDELAAVISHNPYPGEANPKCLHAVFLAAEPSRERLDRVAEVQASVRAAKGGRDSVTAVGRVLYLHTPDGFGTSELAKSLARLPGGGTARNWATTIKLLELCNP
jgi:uncharacterized protein (DUF1697 family)